MLTTCEVVAPLKLVGPCVVWAGLIWVPQKNRQTPRIVSLASAFIGFKPRVRILREWLRKVVHFGSCWKEVSCTSKVFRRTGTFCRETLGGFLIPAIELRFLLYWPQLAMNR